MYYLLNLDPDKMYQDLFNSPGLILPDPVLSRMVIHQAWYFLTLLGLIALDNSVYSW